MKVVGPLKSTKSSYVPCVCMEKIGTRSRTMSKLEMQHIADPMLKNSSPNLSNFSKENKRSQSAILKMLNFTMIF